MEPMDRKYTVYKHTSPSGKAYIGITCQEVSRRWTNSGIGYKGCSYFWNAIVKHGWNNFQHEVLAENLTEAEAKQREKELIFVNQTRNPLYGYNLTEGGDGICGFHHTEESRKRMSAAHKGYTATAETRARISAVGMGRVPTAQARANMTAAQMGNKHNLGRKHTVESLIKMSVAQKGRIISDETKKKMSSAASVRKITLETREKLSAALMGNQRTLGYKHTDETKKKMSVVHTGNKYCLGYKHTDETKAKMSAAQKGKVRSAETRAHMCAVFTGRIVSDETKQKMSEALKGRTFTVETKQKISAARRLSAKEVECLTISGEIAGHFISRADAAEKTGVNMSSIQCACSGRHKTAGGYKWRYVTKGVE